MVSRIKVYENATEILTLLSLTKSTHSLPIVMLRIAANLSDLEGS